MTNQTAVRFGYPHTLIREYEHWFVLLREPQATLGSLVLALVPEFFVHHHPHLEQTGFTLDTSFGFFAWYGFLSCAGMVAGAKILGIFLKRKDTYYDE